MPLIVSITPLPWNPINTSTSEACAVVAITNGIVASSGFSGPCVTMNNNLFLFSAMIVSPYVLLTSNRPAHSKPDSFAFSG